MTYPGPCVICGARDYELSMGGPTICPSCDAGNFTQATVTRQAQELKALREEIDRLRGPMFGLDDAPKDKGDQTFEVTFTAKAFWSEGGWLFSREVRFNYVPSSARWVPDA